MTDTNREQQAEALIAKMKAARGYMYPEWEFAARQDPEFVEAYNRLYELSLGEGRHVSAKVREFVAIALLCFRGGERAGLVAHMRRAIEFGASSSRCSKPAWCRGAPPPSTGAWARSWRSWAPHRARPS